MRETTQLRVILEILESYSKKELFSKHLKRFFHHNRQLGSRDRRVIQQFCYNYFRTGRLFSNHSVEERLALSQYLCGKESSALLQYLLDKTKVSLSEADNFKIPVNGGVEENLFPFRSLLSDQINKASFIRSFLIQPKLWIRVRKIFLKQTIEELKSRNIEFETDESNPYCLAIKNSTTLDILESFKNGYFEIQDWSSQQTINFIFPETDTGFQVHNIHAEASENLSSIRNQKSEIQNSYWWDACSGSGGKSLLMADAKPGISIYATDVRDSVLKNLKERFRKASFKNYLAEKIDVANLPQNFILPSPPVPQSGDRRNSHYSERCFDPPLGGQGGFPDGIVADVPCSGSGTWARTPEWIEMFEESSLAGFQKLQFDIVSNLVRYLPPGKPLVYLTCSAFRAENEDNIVNFVEKLPISLSASGYIKGCEKEADTMFAARLVRN